MLCRFNSLLPSIPINVSQIYRPITPTPQNFSSISNEKKSERIKCVKCKSVNAAKGCTSLKGKLCVKCCNKRKHYCGLVSHNKEKLSRSGLKFDFSFNSLVGDV